MSDTNEVSLRAIFTMEAFDLAKDLSAHGLYPSALGSKSITTILPVLDIIDSIGALVESGNAPLATSSQFSLGEERTPDQPKVAQATPEVENLWSRLEEAIALTGDCAFEMAGTRLMAADRNAVS